MNRYKRPALWHGSDAEAKQLLEVIQRHCECQFDNGVKTLTCSAHAMLLDDQRALDGLLFARRLVRQLRAEEFRRKLPRRA